MPKTFYVNCENNHYLIYLGRICLGIVAKDQTSKKWTISPEKTANTSDPIYTTRRSAVVALKKANYL